MADREFEFSSSTGAPSVGLIGAAEWDSTSRLRSVCRPRLSDGPGRIRAASAPGTGWSPAPIQVREEGRAGLAAAPAYLKSHSQGEYVFDHGWAEAWQRAGGSYYPKLLVAAPFTPVPGPRLLGATRRRSC